MSFQIAMIGLGVMGKSLALNLVDHGIKVAGYDLNQANRIRTLQEAASLSTIAGKGQFAAADDLAHLLGLLDKPRVIALSVPAGDIVDQVITQLLDAGLEPQDIVIDTGNSLWTDSERREHVYTGRLRFFSTAPSLGENKVRVTARLLWQAAIKKRGHSSSQCGKPLLQKSMLLVNRLIPINKVTLAPHIWGLQVRAITLKWCTTGLNTRTCS